MTKPLADFYPKKGGRFGVSGSCRSCDNARSRNYRVVNSSDLNLRRATARELRKDEINAKARERYAENPEAIKASNRRYYERNRARRKEYNAEWRSKNEKRLQEYEQSRSTNSYFRNLLARLRNPEKIRAYMAEYSRLRQTLRADATPPWADRKAIRNIYIACQMITEISGIPHHVDHIVPLKGKRVSGLHVEGNLQIIPASDNLKKSNGFKTDWE